MARSQLPPTILVIFGITGDLSRRYLLPALAGICRNAQLGKDFKILGVSRRDIKLDEVFGQNEQNLKDYSQIFTMDLAKNDDYKKLAIKIDELSAGFEHKPQIIFYLSVPPAAVAPIVESLGQTGLNKDGHKLMLEKPFGFDAESAAELIEHVAAHFKEGQIYRIDHYLAKPMAQNIVIYLSQTQWVKSLLSNEFIEKIEVEAQESIGIEGRAAFYESTGALRDYIPNHLLQLASLILMKPFDDDFNFAQLPPRRLAAIKAIEPVGEKVCARQAVRAQYEGYADEVGNPGSEVETFVSLPLYSSEPRWQGVPIILTTGKKLDQRLTEIKIHFKRDNPADAQSLSMQIQPEQRISLVKWPTAESMAQDFAQHTDSLPDAYQQVLADAMRSNRGLFASSEEILAGWQILQPLQDYWSMHDNLRTYNPGSSVKQVLES